jgi:hypothetical protein
MTTATGQARSNDEKWFTELEAICSARVSSCGFNAEVARLVNVTHLLRTELSCVSLPVVRTNCCDCQHSFDDFLSL